MNSRTIHKSFVLALPILGLSACSMFGTEKSGPSDVDDLVGWVERVYVESELAKEQSESAVSALRAIVDTRFETDAISAHGRFAAAVERSEKQLQKLRSSVEPMKTAAQPVFEKWEESLETYANERMRKRAELRLAATRERYEKIVASVDPALGNLTKINATMRDHATFLTHDFNPESIAMIREDIGAVTMQLAELQQQLDGTLYAARAYVESTALPVASAPIQETQPSQQERPRRSLREQLRQRNAGPGNGR